MVEELTSDMSSIFTVVVAIFIGAFLASSAWIINRLVHRESLVPFSPRRCVPWGPLELLLIVVANALIGAIVLYGFGIDVEQISAVGSSHNTPSDEAVDEEPAPGTDDEDEVEDEVEDEAKANEQSDPVVGLQATALTSVLSLCAALAVLIFISGATFEDIGLSAGHAPGDLWRGVVAFSVVAVPVYALQYELAKWFPTAHPLINTLMKNRDQGLFLLASVMAVIVAPVAEEFLFRVFLQGWLEKIDENLDSLFENFSPPPRGLMPILLTSMLFAAAHIGSGPAPVPLFFLALALGYLYYRTHRILPCIIVHMCLNGCSMWMAWLTIGPGAAN